MSIARRAVSVLAVVLVVAGLLVASTSAAAGPAMTYRSAVVEVGTSSFTVDIALSAADARRVTGPVRIVVTSSDQPALTSDDGGFSGRGYRVATAPGAADASTVTFSITIPARGNVTAEVGVSSATGGALSGPAITNVPLIITTIR